jgi:hypothetical protein
MSTLLPAKDIHNTIYNLLQKGDEQTFRSYLTENYDKFPPDLQESVAAYFVEEAIDRAGQEAATINTLYDEGKKIADALDITKRQLEDRRKTLELQEQLK